MQITDNILFEKGRAITFRLFEEKPPAFYELFCCPGQFHRCTLSIADNIITLKSGTCSLDPQERRLEQKELTFLTNGGEIRHTYSIRPPWCPLRKEGAP